MGFTGMAALLASFRRRSGGGGFDFGKLLRWLCVLAALGFAVACFLSLRKCRTLAVENERMHGNYKYYNAMGRENIVLRQSLRDLEDSRDSVVLYADSLRRELGLKPKETKTIVYVETVLRDTIRDTITAERDFCEVLAPNDYTTIEVERRDSVLTVVPDIRNRQTLWIQEERRFVEECFWKRLFLFRWRKRTDCRYYIENSNDLIKTDDTRVINVTE